MRLHRNGAPTHLEEYNTWRLAATGAKDKVRSVPFRREVMAKTCYGSGGKSGGKTGYGAGGKSGGGKGYGSNKGK